MRTQTNKDTAQPSNADEALYPTVNAIILRRSMILISCEDMDMAFFWTTLFFERSKDDTYLLTRLLKKPHTHTRHADIPLSTERHIHAGDGE